MLDGQFIDKIKYFNMRLLFIHPIYLPSLSEQFLRKDFNFANSTFLKLPHEKLFLVKTLRRQWFLSPFLLLLREQPSRFHQDIQRRKIL